MFRTPESTVNGPSIPALSTPVANGALSNFARRIQRNERPISDAGVYILALGGFFISYQVTFALCIRHGMPHDQAIIVAGLADFAQLVYSRKALHATEDGRSAWVIRLFVIVLSLASFSMNVRDAWPHPTDIGIWGLAPAAWISAHEFMLHGKRRAIKAKRKAEKISQGLLPAPVAKLGMLQFILAPLPMFKVKRVMWLTRCTPAAAASMLIERAEHGKADRNGKIKKGRVYFSWTALLQRESTVPTPVVTMDREPQPPIPPTPKMPLPAAAPIAAAPKPLPAPAPKIALPKPLAIPYSQRPVVKPVTTIATVAAATPAPPSVDIRLAAVGANGKTPLGQLPAALQKKLTDAIPLSNGQRSKKEAASLVVTAEKICQAHGVTCTGALAAQLLGISASRISRIKDAIEAARLAPTGT